MPLRSLADPLGCSLLLLAAQCLATDARAKEPSCQQQCVAERKQKERALKECLEGVDPRPPDRAAKMRLLCRQRHELPRCDGLPPCAPEKRTSAPEPGLQVGPIVFSAVKRGPALARARYAAGGEVFLRLEVQVTPKPRASRIWLKENLRMLRAAGAGPAREIFRWEGYAEEQKLLDPTERGLPRTFTLHGGAILPADLEPGDYLMEAEVKELVSTFTRTVRAAFVVTGISSGKKRGR